MVVGLLFAAAIAAPPTEPRAFQWRTHSLLNQSEHGILVKASSKKPLRLKCPEGIAPPQRQAVIRSSGKPAALASGPWSEAVLKDGYWYFPAPPFLSSIWLIGTSKCTVESLSSSVNGSGLARLEYLADDEKTLMQWVSDSAILSPKQLTWLQESNGTEEWRSRYMTIRPAGPHPTGRLKLDGDTLFDGSQWMSAPEGIQLTLPPHQRHTINAVFLGPRNAACIYLDHVAHCKSNDPDELWTLENGLPKLEEKRWNGLSQSKPHKWIITTGKTPQELDVDGPVLLQVSRFFPQNYMWRGSVHGSVYPPAEVNPQGITVETPQIWESVPPLNAEGLYMMEPVDSIKTIDSAWYELTSLNAIESDTDPFKWLDENGNFSIWIPKNTPDQKCSIRLHNRTHSIVLTESKVHRFIWLNDVPPIELPKLDGCTGLLRIGDPPRHLPTPTLRRRYHEMPVEGLYFSTHAEQKSWFRFAHSPETNRATLRLEQRSGRAHQVEIQYLPQHTERIVDDLGEVWRRPLSLQLDEGWDGLMVYSLTPTRARLSQPSVGESIPIPNDLRFPEMPANPSNIHTLTLQVQQSQTDEVRVRLLEKRAQMFAKLGELQLAQLDMQMANKLRQEDIPLFADLQSQRFSDVLYPYSDWRPVIDDWIEDSEDTPLPIDLLKLAAEDQPLKVAERLSELGRDSRYWWRKAILSGALMSRDNALNAYQQSIQYDALTPQSHSFFWPLRTLSHDAPIYIRPKGITVYRGQWPNENGPNQSNPQAALFAEVFPEQQRRVLVPDKNLIIPPQANEEILALHCRPKSSRGQWGRCAIDIATVDGLERFSVEGEIWGQTRTFSLPPSEKVRFVSVPDSNGLLMEIRIPQSDSQNNRVAWQLKENRPVAFSVLGPTVLRLDTWSFDSIDSLLTVTIESDTDTQVHPKELVGSQHHNVLISEQGIVTVTLKSNHPIRIKPFIRVSNGGQLPPPELIDASEETTGIFMTDTRDSKNQILAPSARPMETNHAARLRLSSNWTPSEPHSHRLGWTHFQRISSATRWWSAGIQAHQYVNAFPVVQGGPFVLDTHAGFDWLHNQGAYQFWLIGDANAGVSLSEPLAAREKLTMTARADRWWRAQLQTIARLKAQQYAQLATHPEPYISTVDSEYWRTHPYQLQPEAEIRFIPSPWVRLQWKAGLKTNAPGGESTVDQVYGTAMLNIGAPQRWLRLYSDIEQRRTDSNRITQQQTQQYGIMMHAGHWIRTDRLIEGRLSFETNPIDEEWVVQTQFAMVKSQNRLSAIRPTQLAMRHAMNWGFDDANNRYWGIIPPSDSVEFEEGLD
ncbi:MAG: hypothetical protein ACON4U_15555 [Myxococcota bacterium]